MATYLDFVSGSTKGGVNTGDIFNSGLKGVGNMDAARINFTAQPVVETAVADGVVAWTPVEGVVERFDGLDSEGKAIWTEIEVSAVVTGDVIRYHYNNKFIPADDIPTLNVVQREIPLLCKDRAIQVYWSNLAEYDLKQQTGEDMSKLLPEQATTELKREIDAEVCAFVRNLAGAPVAEFVKTLPVGVNMRDHFEGFLAVISKLSNAVYKKTLRYRPNYMVCAPDVTEVLAFTTGIKLANITNTVGPYFFGTLSTGIKVFVDPSYAEGEFILGVNQPKVSAAVYGAYMPIIPTMLLGYADGGMNQGFHTVYALEKLNEDLVIAGKVVESTVVADAVHAVVRG